MLAPPPSHIDISLYCILEVTFHIAVLNTQVDLGYCEAVTHPLGIFIKIILEHPFMYNGVVVLCIGVMGGVMLMLRLKVHVILCVCGGLLIHFNC